MKYIIISRIKIVSGLIVLAFGVSFTQAENIVFPADAGVVDITKAPYNASAKKGEDVTKIIQRAFDENAPVEPPDPGPGQGVIIYLPNGIYTISGTIKWPFPTKCTVLQGQSRDSTIIMLADNAAGFGDTSNPKAMLWTGEKPAQRFRNGVRNFTLDVGSGNPGAVALQFMGNNQACIYDILLRTREKTSGWIGLDLGYSDEIGPLLVKNVTVEGFEYGIFCDYLVNSITFENITLREQRRYGIYNFRQVLTIHNLTSENSVPALYNYYYGGLVSLVGARLEGRGAAASKPAIINEVTLFARDVETPGYAKAIENSGGHAEGVDTNYVDEFCSHDVRTVFDSPGKTLGLEIRETPELPWDDTTNWQKVDTAGFPDLASAIQAAIDSGKPTVYFPNGTYNLHGSVRVRGEVRRIIGMESEINMLGPEEATAFIVDTGSAPVVLFERFTGSYLDYVYWIDNYSSRTVVIKNLADCRVKWTGPGDIFIEDVVTDSCIFSGQNVWVRQFNIENLGTHIMNDGAKMWILGLKTERGGTIIHTRNGGYTELLGAHCYNTNKKLDVPMFIVENSCASLTARRSDWNWKYDTLVRETHGGVSRSFLAADNEPALPLFVSGCDTTGIEFSRFRQTMPLPCIIQTVHIRPQRIFMLSKNMHDNYILFNSRGASLASGSLSNLWREKPASQMIIGIRRNDFFRHLSQ